MKYENVNSQAFTPEEVEAGAHLDLINALLKINKKSSDSSYNDIHITTDGYCTIVEWYHKLEDDGAGFHFVGCDQVIFNEVRFPDEHTEYLPEDADEAIAEWLKDNPGYIKNEWGHWVKEDEQWDMNADLKK